MHEDIKTNDIAQKVYNRLKREKPEMYEHVTFEQVQKVCMFMMKNFCQCLAHQRNIFITDHINFYINATEKYFMDEGIVPKSIQNLYHLY